MIWLRDVLTASSPAIIILVAKATLYKGLTVFLLFRLSVPLSKHLSVGQVYLKNRNFKEMQVHLSTSNKIRNFLQLLAGCRPCFYSNTPRFLVLNYEWADSVGKIDKLFQGKRRQYG